MERIYLKPKSSEIIVKGDPRDGFADIYAYDSNSDDASKKLGNLFVVGTVKHDSTDVSYMTSLVSALAKREYYIKPMATPKEAFTNTLKKINEVVQEFFKNTGVVVNMGIFVIAGNQILISKLGRFKILLAREEETIDILNNIQLFEKEHIQEKEFSNIISGKVLESDRLLAFCPSRSVSSRERFIKADFLKLTRTDFGEKIKKIKNQSKRFSCALLYVDLNEVKETAKAPRIQPQELMKATLAAQELDNKNQKKEKGTKIGKKGKPKLTDTNIKMQEKIELTAQETEEKSGEPQILETADERTGQDQAAELPNIISTEFSLGKREGFFGTLLKKVRVLHVNLTPRFRAVLIATGIIGMVIVALVIKSMFFVDPATRKIQEIVQKTETNIRLARTKIDQKETGEARKILFGSIANLYTTTDEENNSTNTLRQEMFELLDSIDLVSVASPVLVYQLSADAGSAMLLSPNDNSLLVYTTDDTNDTSSLLRIVSSSIDEGTPIDAIAPTSLFTTEEERRPILIDTINGRVLIVEEDDKKTNSFDVKDPIIDVSFYDNNLYMLTRSTIRKVKDITKDKNTVQQWLKEDVTLASDNILMAIDGNIHLMSQSGILTTYFRGEEKKQAQTSLQPDPDGMLLEGDDESPYLYLVNKQLGRINVLNKEDGSLYKTYKTGTEQPIVSAAVGPNETIYFITQDNKVWKIK
jgi:hypothetical protein